MHANCVLVVEDDPAVRTIIRRAVSTHYDVIESANLPSAVALARRHHPTLIMIDLGLPGLDGSEMAGLLHVTPSLKPIPIVGMVDNTAPTPRDTALRASCARVLDKPFALITLQEAVVGLLALPSAS